MRVRLPIALLVLLSLALVLAGLAALAAAPKNEPPTPVNDIVRPDEPPPSYIAPGPPVPLAPCSHRPSAILYENGPFVNSPGTGPGGTDESRLQDSTLGMGTYGFGDAVSTGYSVADDFTVTDAAGWTIDSFTFYAYQTGSTTTSTITEVRYQIWNGPPNDAGSSVIFGDLTTNRMTGTTWTNAYRVLLSAPGGTTRPIMANTGSCGIHLDQGTYWVQWQAAGTLTSGPWAPPITINGQTTTGNALQADNVGTWTAVTDVDPQGFPFRIDGTAGAVPSAEYDHHTAYDYCGVQPEAGGDGFLEPNETVDLYVYLHNDGTLALTGITATLTSSTPGLTILSGTASYGDMAVGATAGPGAPFRFVVPAGATCGQSLDFSLSIQTGQGTFADTFSDVVGNVSAGSGTLLNESFEGSFPPSGWSTNSLNATTNVWTRNDYWGATNNTGGSGYCADADSDGSGGYLGGWDTELLSPAFTVPAAATACTLTYKSNFQDYIGDGEAWQDISTDGGSNWTNLYYTSVDEPSTGTTHTADLLPYAGQSVILRWRYSDNENGYAWYWRIDDVLVDYTAPGSCDMTVCEAVPASGMSFYDDEGKSQLCIDEEAGTWSYTIFGGAGAGTYSGNCVIGTGPFGTVTFSGAGRNNSLEGSYSPLLHNARAVCKVRIPYANTDFMRTFKVPLRDRNTLDDPPCGVSPDGAFPTGLVERR